MIEQGFEGYRLSPQQTRAWRGQQGAARLAQCAILVDGPLQPDVLHRAVCRVIERHEILRTRFVRSAGIKLPFQVVMDQAQPVWEMEDWTEIPPAQHFAKIDGFFAEQEATPLDFERAPLL